MDEHVFRHLIRRMIESTQHVDELIVLHVQQKKMSTEQRKMLAAFAEKERLNAPTTLTRIVQHDPKFKKGDMTTFDTGTSFSVIDLTRENAGAIGWKYSDEAIITIRNATRGINVDYSLPGISRDFYAGNEREVIIGGTYRIVDVIRIVEPFTNEQYGYTVPLYVLQEA